MLMPRIIPCLDVRDGRVVKGVRFQGLRDVGDPAELAARYEAQGADEIVVLDVAATVGSRSAALATVAQVRRALGIPLTVGGGVRSAGDARRLLEAGADKVAVNSAAVERPGLIDEIADRFGRQCCVLAVDAARDGLRWRVLTHSGSRPALDDAAAWITEGVWRGAGEILLTSWDEDGRGQGYDLDVLAAVCGTVRVPVIASGGARTAEHLSAGLTAGASAVLVASTLHDGLTTIGQLKTALTERGHEVRA